MILAEAEAEPVSGFYRKVVLDVLPARFVFGKVETRRGEPVSYAEVECFFEGSSVENRRYTWTSASGYFLIPVKPFSKMRIRTGVHGVKSPFFEFPWGVRFVSLVMEMSDLVGIRVVDSKGIPVTKYRISRSLPVIMILPGFGKHPGGRGYLKIPERGGTPEWFLKTPGGICRVLLERNRLGPGKTIDVVFPGNEAVGVLRIVDKTGKHAKNDMLRLTSADPSSPGRSRPAYVFFRRGRAYPWTVKDIFPGNYKYKFSYSRDPSEIPVGLGGAGKNAPSKWMVEGTIYISGNEVDVLEI